MKDFGAEVRASMDVDQFLIQAVLLLDVQETSLEGIVDKMLQKVRNSGFSGFPSVLGQLGAPGWGSRMGRNDLCSGTTRIISVRNRVGREEGGMFSHWDATSPGCS